MGIKEEFLHKEITERFEKIREDKEILVLDIDYCKIINPESYAKKTTSTFPFAFNFIRYQETLGAETYSEVMSTLPSMESSKLLVNKMFNIISLFPNLKIIVHNKNKTFNPLLNIYAEGSEEHYQLTVISNRIWDLNDIILNKEYYHPNFKGSNYLKDVSKISAPLVYSESDVIKNGVQAENYFKQNTTNGKMLNKNTVEEIRSYVIRDTRAILETFFFLKNKL